MPIALGVFGVAGAGAGPVAAGNAYEWLETQILTGTQADVTFSNLNSTYSSTYKHLQLRFVTRTNRSDTNDRLYLNFNGETGNNIFTHQLYGDGSTVSSNFGFGAGNTLMILEAGSPGANATGSAFAAGVIDFLDPFVTNKNLTVRAFYGNQPQNRVHLNSGLWNNTAALTTIKLSAIGSFVAGTRFSLYGMRSS